MVPDADCGVHSDAVMRYLHSNARAARIVDTILIK